MALYIPEHVQSINCIKVNIHKPSIFPLFMENVVVGKILIFNLAVPCVCDTTYNL